MPIMKIDYYILVDGPSIKKVKGKPLKVGDPPITFYYQNIEDENGNSRFVVTIPDSGIKLCTGSKLKDCKEYILNNMDYINKEIRSEKYNSLKEIFQSLKNNI